METSSDQTKKSAHSDLSSHLLLFFRSNSAQKSAHSDHSSHFLHFFPAQIPLISCIFYSAQFPLISCIFYSAQIPLISCNFIPLKFRSFLAFFSAQIPLISCIFYSAQIPLITCIFFPLKFRSFWPTKCKGFERILLNCPIKFRSFLAFFFRSFLGPGEVTYEYQLYMDFVGSNVVHAVDGISGSTGVFALVPKNGNNDKQNSEQNPGTYHNVYLKFVSPKINYLFPVIRRSTRFYLSEELNDHLRPLKNPFFHLNNKTMCPIIISFKAIGHPFKISIKLQKRFCCGVTIC